MLHVNRLKSGLSINQRSWTSDRRSMDEDNSSINRSTGSTRAYLCTRLHVFRVRYRPLACYQVNRRECITRFEWGGGDGGSIYRARGAANASQKRKRSRCKWARDCFSSPARSDDRRRRRPKAAAAGGGDGGRNAEAAGDGGRNAEAAEGAAGDRHLRVDRFHLRAR